MKPRLLDLFCKAGGATKGYQRAGFYVVGVDIEPQPNYCGDEFIQADALDVLAGDLSRYAAVHASPPCQGYLNEHFRVTPSGHVRKDHPRLIAPTRRLLRGRLPYVIENVPTRPLALLAATSLALASAIVACGADDAKLTSATGPAVRPGPHRSDVSSAGAADERDARTSAARASRSTTTVARASRNRRVPPTKPPVSLGVRPDAATDVGGARVGGGARVSWYARGCCTASGERFDPDGLTFAHRTMRFGTRVRFCRDGRCVVSRCNDRGPAAYTGREFDLSRGAFRAIAPLSAGVVSVTWEVVG